MADCSVVLFYFPGGQGLVEATNNRDYVVSKMSKEIEEIIRVLQLTTYDEEEWDADDITVMKKALVFRFIVIRLMTSHAFVGMPYEAHGFVFTLFTILFWILDRHANFSKAVLYQLCSCKGLFILGREQTRNRPFSSNYKWKNVTFYFYEQHCDWQKGLQYCEWQLCS